MHTHHPHSSLPLQLVRPCGELPLVKLLQIVNRDPEACAGPAAAMPGAIYATSGAPLGMLTTQAKTYMHLSGIRVATSHFQVAFPAGGASHVFHQDMSTRMGAIQVWVWAGMHGGLSCAQCRVASADKCRGPSRVYLSHFLNPWHPLAPLALAPQPGQRCTPTTHVPGPPFCL